MAAWLLGSTITVLASHCLRHHWSDGNIKSVSILLCSDAVVGSAGQGKEIGPGQHHRELIPLAPCCSTEHRR